MKIPGLMLGLAVAGTLFSASAVEAQNYEMTPTSQIRRSFSTYPRIGRHLKYALQDKYSPNPYYAYGRRGIDAQRTHEWNVNQSGSYSWHGDYSYWRWQRPTALVVPPTASFESEYNWGVANTRSLPIYHQFGRDGAGMIGGGGAASGQFAPTPYYPWSTNQFGVYPVRGPWHH